MCSILKTKNFKQQGYQIGNTTTWKRAKDGEKLAAEMETKQPRGRRKNKEWLPEGGRAVSSEIQLGFCV